MTYLENISKSRLHVKSFNRKFAGVGKRECVSFETRNKIVQLIVSHGGRIRVYKHLYIYSLVIFFLSNSKRNQITTSKIPAQQTSFDFDVQFYNVMVENLQAPNRNGNRFSLQIQLNYVGLWAFIYEQKKYILHHIELHRYSIYYHFFCQRLCCDE